METNEKVENNRVLNFIAVSNIVIFVILAWGLARQEELKDAPPPMRLETVWSLEDGRTKHFTSYRNRLDTFEQFVDKHNAAVAAQRE